MIKLPHAVRKRHPDPRIRMRVIRREMLDIIVISLDPQT
jgi:hypothetical protein